jgi:radical SAM-linked protein
MEDFIGRGDRSLAAVVRKAWELGAGMDAWWENSSQAFAAWSEAIAVCGLTWKYRQIEEGEWNVMEAKNQAISTGKRPKYTWDERLNAPLPWDHLNTGIDKNWLKAELQRAQEATNIGDCAFDGCSQCGICGSDFGHNIVIEPPQLPQFVGNIHPNQARVQRLRVWFGKLGNLALVSHLDLNRLFERVVRRAAIPISFTGGFHAGPRISLANALALGATSSGEIVDFELTQRMDVNEFREKLIANLPVDLPIYRVEDVRVKDPSATQLLEKAEYLLTISTDEPVSLAEWENWLTGVMASPVIEWEKTTKSGKLVTLNLRDRLFALSLDSDSLGENNSVKIRYLGGCSNDGTQLQPAMMVYMLEQIAKQELHVSQVHRLKLILST